MRWKPEGMMVGAEAVWDIENERKRATYFVKCMIADI